MNYNLIENKGSGRNETVETEGFCIIQGDKNHATLIKIFIDSYNSIKFDWINKHTTSL
jgi:hypothetical protein